MANFCTNCGKALEADWKICPYCGTEVFKSEKSYLAEDSDLEYYKQIERERYTPLYERSYNSQVYYQKVEKEKRKLSKKQKKVIIIISIIIAAAITIPLVTVFGLFRVRIINYYVGNGFYARTHVSFIPHGSYNFYANLPHPSHDFPDWDDVALMISSYCTPNDNEIIKIAQEVKNNCLDQNNDEEVVNALLSFTQGIEYKAEITDIAQYPLETLVNQGDCEDLSIFFGSLVEALGYEAILMCVVIYNESTDTWIGHCCVGVHLDFVPSSHDSFPPSYYYNTTSDDNQYWVCETTYQGWMIGQLPSSDPSYFLVTSYAYV